MTPLWNKWTKRQPVSPVEEKAKSLNVPIGVALSLCQVEADTAGLAAWRSNPIIRDIERAGPRAVKRIRLKRFADWQALYDLWIRSGLSRHAYSREMMWWGVEIVWDASAIKGSAR